MKHPVTIEDIDFVIDEAIDIREKLIFVIDEINKIENKIFERAFSIPETDIKDYRYLHKYLSDYIDELYRYPNIEFFRSYVDKLVDTLHLFEIILNRCNRKQRGIKSAYQWLYFKVRWILFRIKHGPDPKTKI